MPNNLEDVLTRTFAAAASTAPEPAVDLTARVANRRRLRSAQSALVAGLAVVAVAATSITVISTVHGTPDTTLPAAPPSDVSTARPAAEVWPKAMVRLPAKLPDGRDYAVVGHAPDGRFVAMPMGQYPGQVYYPPVLLSPTGAVTVLFPDVTGRDGVHLVTDRNVYWTVSEGANEANPRGTRTTTWRAPIVGGPAEKVIEVDDREYNYRPVEAGDTLYAAADNGARQLIHRVNGRALEPVPDAEGWYPVGGPWLTDQRTPNGIREAMTPPESRPPTAAPRFRNLATGQRVNPTVPHNVGCSPEWCVELIGERLTARHSTGGSERSVQGKDLTVLLPAGSGRFVNLLRVGQQPRMSYVWDLRSNTVARLGAQGQSWGDALTVESTADGKIVVDPTRMS